MKPSRTDWQPQHNVTIHSPIESGRSLVKNHPQYNDAKAGDYQAALQVVNDTIDNTKIGKLKTAFSVFKPVLASVHAYEEAGVNAIPEAFAEVISARTGFKIDNNIVQINVVGHTKANGFKRMARQALFDGEVNNGENYILVDDFIGQGGTLANMKGYIESKGGKVIGCIALTGKPHSAKLALESETLAELRSKHGILEQW